MIDTYNCIFCEKEITDENVGDTDGVIYTCEKCYDEHVEEWEDMKYGAPAADGDDEEDIDIEEWV